MRPKCDGGWLAGWRPPHTRMGRSCCHRAYSLLYAARLSVPVGAVQCVGDKTNAKKTKNKLVSASSKGIHATPHNTAMFVPRVSGISCYFSVSILSTK